MYDAAAALQNRPASTYLSIANPYSQSIAVRLELLSSRAVPIGNVQTRVLPPHGVLQQRVTTLFGMRSVAPDSYVRVRVTDGRAPWGWSGSGSPAPSPPSGSTVCPPAPRACSTRPSSPPARVSSPISSSSNAADRQVQVTAQALSADGPAPTAPVTVTIEPNQVYMRDLGEMFGLDPRRLFIGSLRLEASGEGIVGDVLFGDPELNYMAAIPLQAEPFRRAVFPHVAHNDLFYTGIALFNPGPSSAEILLGVYSAAGTLMGESRFSLAPGGRLSRILDELIPSLAPQNRGYIELRSTRPVAAQQVFGHRRGDFLSAVLPAPLPP